jgi:undecaprenyl-diphosphatase
MLFSKKSKLVLLLPLLVLPFFLIDTSVANWIQDLYGRSAELNRLNQAAAPAVRLLTDGGTLAVFALALLLYGRAYNRRLFAAGRTLIVGLLSAGAVVQVLKHLAGRARPRITHELVFIGPSLKSGYDSFPSGHTMAAFCFAAIISEYFPRYRFAAYLFALFTGLTRLNGLSHFPSDVAAGAVLGFFIGTGLVAYPSRGRNDGTASQPQRQGAR